MIRLFLVQSLWTADMFCHSDMLFLYLRVIMTLPVNQTNNSEYVKIVHFNIESYSCNK